MKKILLLTGLVGAVATLTAADQKEPPQRPLPPPPVVSPELHSDRTVTFRIRAPNAKEVSVSGEWPGGTQPMTRGTQDVWSVTVGPLAPDLYGYGFSVDGFRSLDPANPEMKPMRSATTSILDVPAAAPRLYDFQPSIPHGTMRQHTYQSTALDKPRRLHVYTPPGYDQQPTTRYPVLYLLHGSGDNDATWTALGRAHFIADNLLSQRKAVPMVIVMTDGHAVPPSFSTNAEARTRNLVAYERDLLEDVMPFIAANYRVKSDSSSRAVIGLSMGGGQSLTVGLKHPELFGWIGGMSSGVRDPEATVAPAIADPDATNRRLKLLWLACGKDDFLVKTNRHLAALLQANRVRHEYHETDGNHSWPVWRRYLGDFLPRLFPVGVSPHF